jgi:hypothetical protein
MWNILQIALPSQSVHNYQYNYDLEAVHMSLTLTDKLIQDLMSLSLTNQNT